MVLITSKGWIGRESVLTIVFHPERGSVANLTAKILKSGNSDWLELVSSTAEELGNTNLFLWDRVTEWGCGGLLAEIWQNVHCLSALISECIFILIDEDVVDEFVVGHGWVVKHLVLMHQIDNILWIEVAQTNVELAVISCKSWQNGTATAIENPAASNLAIFALDSQVPAWNVDPEIGEWLDSRLFRCLVVLSRVGQMHPRLDIGEFR